MDSRCKICFMTKWNMPLFLKVHELRFGGLSNQNIQKYLDTEISAFNTLGVQEAKGKKFVPRTKVSDSAIANHFKKHVPAPLAVNAEIKHAITPYSVTASPFPPKVENTLAAMQEKVDQDNLNDFQSFHSLVERVQARFDQVDKEIQEGKKMSMEEIAAFRAMAEILGRFRKDSIQLRNQDRMLQTALSSVMDTFSINALTEILKALDTLIMEFRPSFQDPLVADKLAAKFRQTLASVMIQSAKLAVNAVREQLKTG